MLQTIMCPICNMGRIMQSTVRTNQQEIVNRISCEVCGTYDIDDSNESAIVDLFNKLTREKKGALSHYIRVRYRPDLFPKFSLDKTSIIISEANLPDEEVQLRNIIWFIGTHLKHIGPLDHLPLYLQALIGAKDYNDLYDLLEKLKSRGLIEFHLVKWQMIPRAHYVYLTREGEKLYNEINKPTLN